MKDDCQDMHGVMMGFTYGLEARAAKRRWRSGTGRTR
jgi:hypothetical protein